MSVVIEACSSRCRILPPHVESAASPIPTHTLMLARPRSQVGTAIPSCAHCSCAPTVHIAAHGSAATTAASCSCGGLVKTGVSPGHREPQQLRHAIVAVPFGELQSGAAILRQRSVHTMDDTMRTARIHTSHTQITYTPATRHNKQPAQLPLAVALYTQQHLAEPISQEQRHTP